ncbi:Mce-associated membrane protein [Marmoricola sp. URHA0025 HA25]
MANNPTWYDILGVERDATPEQVKAAWRAATDKFEPGSGTSQFRLFNEAADVLLDPARREAYDAELAGPDAPAAVDTAAAAPEPEPEPEPAPESLPDADADRESEPDVLTAPDASPADEPAPTSTPTSSPTEGPRPVTWLGARLGWVVVICVPVLVACLVAALVSVLGLHVWKADVEGAVPAAHTFDAGPDASAAAERALKAVLSYDYRHMEADRDRAVQFLTPSYRKDYLKTFNGLLAVGPDGSPGPVEKTKAVVTADVLDTGVVDAESDRVRIIAFVNQSSVKGDAQPTVFQNRVVATMVHRGDNWLVDNLTSY